MKPDMENPALTLWTEVYRCLSQQEATLVDLRFAHGIPQARLAEMTEMNYKEVEKHLRSALKKLRHNKTIQALFSHLGGISDETLSDNTSSGEESCRQDGLAISDDGPGGPRESVSETGRGGGN